MSQEFAWFLQVQQGLIWVWAESGGDAFLESTQRGPVVNPLKQATPPEQFTSSYINYIRDLPGMLQDLLCEAVPLGCLCYEYEMLS